MNAKTKKILVSSLLGVAVAGAAVGVGFAIAGGGSYELTDFIVNTSGVTLNYEIGDDVSLSGLTMTAIYSDDSSENVDLASVKVFLGEEDITNNLSKITETVGEKKVKIVYTTKYGEKSKELTFTVTEEGVNKTVVVAYAAPQFIAQYQDSVDKATNDATAADFESEFFQTEDTTYAVGADNAFKFKPNAYDDEMEVMNNVIVNSTVKMMVEDEYVDLIKSSVEGQAYVYEYKYENVTYVVENAAKNEFNFASDAIGKEFFLSAALDTTVYETQTTLRAVELAIEVVDGYNVYTAAELAVLDNSNRNEWKSIKASLGLTDVVTNGIVLHGDMKVTTDHIPTEFTYTLEQSYNIVYKKGTTTGSPEDFGLNRTFLWDKYWTESADNGGVHTSDYVDLFVRHIPTGGDFGFYGNYYSLDLSALPLVASFDAGKTATGSYVKNSNTWYGTDFSNATFLFITGNETTVDGEDENFLFKNLAVRGNGETESVLVTNGTQGYQNNETLVYCGSLILTKFHNITLDLENVRTYKFYISFFGAIGADMNINYTKCYDSTANAMYIWKNADVNIKKSYFQRAGGPLILIQHAGWDSTDPQATMAKINISADSVMEAYVDGSEAWFQSIPGSNAILANFRQLDAIFQNAGNVLAMGGGEGIGKSLYRATDGKMNMIALLMSNGTDPQAAMGALGVQGSVAYGTTKLDRITDSLPVGATVQGILAKTAGAAPTFNVSDNVYYYGGDAYGVMTPTGTTANSGYGALAMELQTASHIAINYGGLGLLFGLFDHAIVG